MRYLKNRIFERDLKHNDLDDEDIIMMLEDILKGRASSLGSKMYKIRGVGEGKGKRGGFRGLFFWKKNERIIFCSLFAKNEQDDVSADDEKVLGILSREYDHLTEDEIAEGIKRNIFKEIKYEKQGA